MGIQQFPTGSYWKLSNCLGFPVGSEGRIARPYFVSHADVLGKALNLMTTHDTTNGVVAGNEEGFSCFAQFPESF